jgi:hypothetical protein
MLCDKTFFFFKPLIFRTRKNIHVPNETLEGLRKNCQIKAEQERNLVVWARTLPPFRKAHSSFVGLAYQGKDIVFGFILEYSSLRDFGPSVIIIIIIIIGLFLYEEVTMGSLRQFFQLNYQIF